MPSEIRLLVSARADPNVAFKYDGETALHRAVRSG
jgi:hypothetical protein